VLFLFHACRGLKPSTSLLRNVWLRVPTRSTWDFLTFGVCLSNKHALLLVELMLSTWRAEISTYLPDFVKQTLNEQIAANNLANYAPNKTNVFIS
jgi:hypothetical protein